MADYPNTEKYITALMDGRLAFLVNLARQYGEILGEYRFRWADGNLEILVDDMHFSMEAYFCGEIVCSTKTMTYLDGDWWKIIAPHKDKIEKIIQRDKDKKNHQLFRQLMKNTLN